MNESHKRMFRSFISGSGGFVVNRLILKKYGPEMAIFLADLADRDEYWSTHNPKYDGWFYSTKEERYNVTNMSFSTLERLLKQAKDMGIIDTKMAGVPAKQWFFIQYERIEHEVMSFDSVETISTSIARARESEPPCASDAIYSTKKQHNSPEMKACKNPVSHPSKIEDFGIEEFPNEYQSSNEFSSMWKLWIAHRKEKGTAIHKQKTTLSLQIKMLTNYSPAHAAAILEKSIMNGWTGLFPDKVPAPPQQETTIDSTTPRPAPDEDAPPKPNYARKISHEEMLAYMDELDGQLDDFPPARPITRKEDY